MLLSPTIKIFLSRKMLVVLLMGFASGLPMALIGGTLQAWLTEEGVSLTLVTFTSFTGTPYAYKFLWAPVTDRYRLLGLGLRRGWIISAQLFLAALLLILGHSHPGQNLSWVILVATIIGYTGATQDIAIDAYRAEVLSEAERAAGASLAVLGYRIAMLVSGGLALILAAHLSWAQVYSVMSIIMIVCAVVTWLSPEPSRPPQERSAFFKLAKQGFKDFLKRRGAIEILLFVLLYKLGDVMAAAPSTRFMMDIGFQKETIGTVAKTFGILATIVGGITGGAVLPKLGTLRALFLFGLLQSGTIALFALLANTGPDLMTMQVAVTVENFCNGMGTAAFTAFLMGLCRREFTATQYALLTSIMAITRYVGGSLTGYIASQTGWVVFFLLCIVSAIPGLLLLTRYKTWDTSSD